MPTVDEGIDQIHDSAMAARHTAMANTEAARAAWLRDMTSAGKNQEPKQSMPLPELSNIPLDPDIFQHWFAAKNGQNPQFSPEELLLIQLIRGQKRLYETILESQKTARSGSESNGGN